MRFPEMDPLHAAALLLGLASCVTDLRMRRVPNRLTFGGVALALVMRFATEGGVGVAWGVLGCAVGLLILLPLFALRGLGGGDVKLLAAFGAFTGPRLVVWTGLYGAIAGGVLAVLVTVSHGVLRRTLLNLRFMLTHWRAGGIRPIDALTLENSSSPKLPYAIPLACGLVVALWVKV